MSRIRSGQRGTKGRDAPAVDEGAKLLANALAGWRELLAATVAARTGRQRAASDLYPLTPDADIAAMRREQAWRDRELADLPDPEPTYIDPDEIPSNE